MDLSTCRHASATAALQTKQQQKNSLKRRYPKDIVIDAKLIVYIVRSEGIRTWDRTHWDPWDLI